MIVNFKNRLLWIGSVLLCTFGLAACDDVHQIAWSPDGNTMALAASDGLRFGDDKGNLSQPTLRHPKQLAWLPDSKRILVADSFGVKTWSEANALLTESQRKEVLELAQYEKKVLELQGLKGVEEDARINKSPQWLSVIALLNLKDTDSASLSKNVDASSWKEIQGLVLNVNTLQVIPANDLGTGAARELWRGFGEIKDVRVSPDGKYALFVHEQALESDLFDVELVSLDLPERSVKIADSASMHVAWSPDSRQMVFLQGAKNHDNKLSLGLLISVKLRAADGSVLKTSEPPISMVNVILNRSADFRCLSDGRVLFSAADVNLPTTADDISGIENVFSFKVGDRLSRRLMARADSEQMKGISLLRVNPGETWAALANAGSQEFSLLNIATGQVQHLAIDPNSEPCWRNADEVCFARPVAKKLANQHDSQVVLHSISTGEDRVISQNWPKSAVDEFLIHTKDKH